MYKMYENTPAPPIQPAKIPWQMKVEELPDGCVLVSAVDNNGRAIESGNLLHLTPAGTIRFPDVNNKLEGLVLDYNNRIGMSFSQ